MAMRRRADGDRHGADHHDLVDDRLENRGGSRSARLSMNFTAT
jgi:hypothetical protein